MVAYRRVQALRIWAIKLDVTPIRKSSIRPIVTK